MADTVTSKDVKMPSGQEVVVSEAPGWQNWRTLGINFAMFIAPVIVTWLAGVNWTDYLSPTHAVWVVTAVNIAMRFVTSGPALSNVKVNVK